MEKTNPKEENIRLVSDESDVRLGEEDIYTCEVEM
jgi:hypothetical protein